MATPAPPSPSAQTPAASRGFPVILTVRVLVAPAAPERQSASLQEQLCFLFEPGFDRRSADAAMGKAMRALGHHWPLGPSRERDRWRVASFDDGPGAMASISVSARESLPEMEDHERAEALILFAGAIAREIGQAISEAAGASHWARVKDHRATSHPFFSVKAVFETLQSARAAREDRRQINEALAPCPPSRPPARSI